jgi:hypothetical protein
VAHVTLRRTFLALVTATVALSAGCGLRSYLPLSSSAPMVGPQAASLAADVDAFGRKKPKPAPGHSDRPITFVTMSGTVTKLLPDDTVGLPHQHFLYRGTDGRVYKVAHNTELAPYVPVKVGDAVSFKGELVKASPNDVMHWTHYNPRGGDGGYIEHKGKKYDRK